MESTEARVYLEVQKARAVGLFARHQLEYASADRWRLKRPEDNLYRTEVAHLLGGKILIHGDIPALVFDFSNPNLAAFELLMAIAEAHLPYLAEKVVLGEPYDFVPAVAMFDIDKDIKLNGEKYGDVMVQALRSLRNGCENGSICSELELVDHLHMMHGDGLIHIEEEQWPQYGHVLSVGLVLAQEAVRKLLEVLSKG